MKLITNKVIKFLGLDDMHLGGGFTEDECIYAQIKLVGDLVHNSFICEGFNISLDRCLELICSNYCGVDYEKFKEEDIDNSPAYKYCLSYTGLDVINLSYITGVLSILPEFEDLKGYILNIHNLDYEDFDVDNVILKAFGEVANYEENAILKDSLKADIKNSKQYYNIIVTLLMKTCSEYINNKTGECMPYDDILEYLEGTSMWLSKADIGLIKVAISSPKVYDLFNLLEGNINKLVIRNKAYNFHKLCRFIVERPN